MRAQRKEGKQDSEDSSGFRCLKHSSSEERMFGAALLAGWRRGSCRLIVGKLAICRPYRPSRVASSATAWSTVYRHLVTNDRNDNHLECHDAGRQSYNKDGYTSSNKKSYDDSITKGEYEAEQKFPVHRTFSSEVFTVPNLITITRITASPYLAYLIYTVFYLCIFSF